VNKWFIPVEPEANFSPALRTEILEWISIIPYTSHHSRISDSRLEGTGEWIFAKTEYHKWRAFEGSKLLLLRGIRKLPTFC
jgi:hypothetical protein